MLRRSAVRSGSSRGHADPPPRRRRAAANAWKIADRLGWTETYDAEYVVLTKLQADAFVTLNAELVRLVGGIVPTATIDALKKA